MKISVNGDSLSFSRPIRGKIQLKQLRFRDEAAEPIHIADMYGESIVTLPAMLGAGPYNILCDEKDVNDGKAIFLGKKPKVVISRNEYTKFDNKRLFRYQIDFGSLNVMPERDFAVFSDEKKVWLYSRDCVSKYDFLLFETNLKIHLSDELKQFLDEPGEDMQNGR